MSVCSGFPRREDPGLATLTINMFCRVEYITLTFSRGPPAYWDRYREPPRGAASPLRLDTIVTGHGNG